ncbi:MAG: hypothetical protein GX594_15650 [Pirellulaceae bacterium]|nr:hypothetical protein [Pirellulaceae bacterium]
MPDILDNLKSLDLDAIRPVFPELIGEEKDAGREWVGDRRHVRRTDRTVLLDARRLQNALDHIGRLPEPGEAFHLVTAKRYSLWHVIEAVLELAAPATIAYLGIATLGFSKANLDDLLHAIDAGQIGKVDFLYSVYFKSNERESCERLAHELTTRGQRVVAMLTHAKVLLMQLSDGRDFVAESSANLRSCGSIEQIMLTHNRDLLDFHKAWINEIMEAK